MKLTKENLMDWIDRSPSDIDLDIINDIVNKDNEIERLNNIINTLEDLIIIKLQRDYHEPNHRISTGDLEEIYDKLRELKGDNKSGKS